MVGDRYIKIGCISNLNRTSNSPLPDYIALETSVEFNAQKDYEGVGSFVLDNGGDIPRVNVYILDPETNQPIIEAKIGQILKFVISMETDYFNYDLRAVNLTASSDIEELELIGRDGCPRNLGIFPELQKEVTQTSRILFAKFKAFKFSSSPMLKFNVKIQFCYKSCPPTYCGINVISHGRKRRDSKIVTPPNINPVEFPGGPVVFNQSYSTLSPVTFSKSQNDLRNISNLARQLTTSKPDLSEITANVNDQYHYEIFDTENRSSNMVHGVQHYFGEFRTLEETNEVKVEEVHSSKYNRKRSDSIVSIPLNISLNVVESDVNGTDRLVIGKNDQIMVMGKNDQVLVSGYGKFSNEY